MTVPKGRECLEEEGEEDQGEDAWGMNGGKETMESSQSLAVARRNG